MNADLDITGLLLAWRDGATDAIDKLFPRVYDQLRRIAHRQLGRERAEHTLGTTGLVHEAYLKLVDQSRVEWRDRSHFFAVAATAMRQIIVDRARRRGALKRGRGVRPGFLDETEVGADSRTEEILALDQALGQLAALSERMVKMVELRFFAGLS